MQESKKLNIKLQKEINARIEEETKALASNESYSLRVSYQVKKELELREVIINFLR